MKKVLVLLIGEVLEDPRVYRTCMSLAGADVNVTVACTNPSHRPEREMYEGLAIVRFPHRRDFIVKRFYNWLKGKVHPSLGGRLERGHENVPESSLAAALRNAVLMLNFNHFMKSNRAINRMMTEAFRNDTFDLVHCNDVDTLFAGWELKRAGAAGAMLYDAHEYWSGIGVHGSRPNEALRKIEEKGIAHADYVVTVNPMIAGRLDEQYGLDETPSVVMNCPYLYEGELATDTLHSPVRVVYQGKLQAFRGLSELVAAFEHIGNAALTLSGYGPLEVGLQRLARSLHIADRVFFTGRYDPHETIPILVGHDIGVLPFRDVTHNIRYSSPNKLFDYAMAGCAVAASNLPFLNETVRGCGMGELFDDISPEGIAEKLNGLISDGDILLKYKNNARAAAMETFNWEEQFWKNYPWRPDS